METKSENQQEKEVNKYIRRKTILSFSVLILFFVCAVVGWKWLRQQPTNAGALKPLRTLLNANEKVNNAIFSETHLAKEYPKSMAVKNVRVNGNVGMNDDFDADNWKLIINRHPENSSPDSTLELTMEDIYSIPKRDIVFDFKCIEGWSQITYWGGVKFSDFITKYHLGTHSGKTFDTNHPEDLYKYVGLMTPDSEYYVGIDIKSMLQPQTILSYELNEKPLPMNQGYPLRLIIPVKYGVKNLKRICYIYFSDTPPKDYWFERGYVYDAAL
ncbi:MAG: molybdopterin-dependent oxidoreductase [Bacteroidia bacterium]